MQGDVGKTDASSVNSNRTGIKMPPYPEPIEMNARNGEIIHEMQ